MFIIFFEVLYWFQAIPSLRISTCLERLESKTKKLRKLLVYSKNSKKTCTFSSVFYNPSILESMFRKILFGFFITYNLIDKKGLIWTLVVWNFNSSQFNNLNHLIFINIYKRVQCVLLDCTVFSFMSGLNRGKEHS